MTNSKRALWVITFLVGGGVVPERAFAQALTRTTFQTEATTAQERELLVLANELAKRCSERMERWLANKEVTEERLFSFLYYPVPKTDPPKYNTDWDRLSDRDILPLQEAALAKSQAIIYAVMADKNGYVPTHNQRYSQPLTGNAANDLVNNRTKRIFHDQTGFAAARNEGPLLIQRYMRDTGELMADLSVPVFVRGVRWGVVRIGYRAVDGK